MIALASIRAIVLRHVRIIRRDPNSLLGIFYWPLLDILIWGFVGAWIAQSQSALFKNYELVALLGVLLWQFVGRGCNVMIFAFAEELWSNNIVNLCSLPLRLSELMIGIALFNMLVMILTALFSALVIYSLYTISIMQLLSMLLIFMPPLLLCGIWLGFICLAIITTLGKRGIELAFVLAWFLLPFSGAYYPLEVLPAWGQMISSLLPMGYIFTGMREYITYQHDPTCNLIIGYILAILYTIVAIILLAFCFNRSRQKGLTRLTD